MNKEQILDLLDALKWDDFKSVIKYSDIEVKEDNTLDIEKSKREQILRNIMSKIEVGDYDFFNSQRYNKKYKNEYVKLMSFSSKIDDIKQIVSEHKKLKLNSFQIRRLIIATHQSSYIREIIENKATVSEMKLNSSDLVQLISEIGEKYIISIIEDKDKIKQFKFGNSKLTQLIIATKNKKYIKKIIEDSEKRKLYKLKSSNLTDLISETSPKYIEEILNNAEKIDEYNLDIYDIFELIKATKDYEYIKSIIGVDEKREELDLIANDLIELVLATENKQYILDILEEREKVVSNLLDKKYMAHLLFLTQKKEYIQENVKKFLPNWDSVPQNKDVKINLPKKMTVGVEIETQGVHSNAIKKLTNIIGKGWVCKSDASLGEEDEEEGGVEVTSPIMTGDFDKATDELEMVCNRLDMLRSTFIK